MSVAVVLDFVDVALADVTQVAGTQGDVAKGNVNAQEMAAGKAVEGMRGADVMPAVAEREYLVIALSVFRAEHESKHRHIQLVARPERLATYLKLIDCGSRC